MRVTLLAALRAASPWPAVLARGDDPPEPPRGAWGRPTMWAGPVLLCSVLPVDAYRWTRDSGPALTGNCAVLTTWTPACCSPLKGVTIGAVAPGSQPRLNGTFGSLNQT